MANDDDKEAASPRRSPVSRQKAKPAEARPFDMWLHKQLHAMYDEIASEPLPGDLINLIDGDAAASSGTGSRAGPGKKSPGDEEK